jgi:hypothetical protein
MYTLMDRLRSTPLPASLLVIVGDEAGLDKRGFCVAITGSCSPTHNHIRAFWRSCLAAWWLMTSC